MRTPPLRETLERYKKTPVESLALSVQVRNALRRNGINNLFTLIVRYYGEGMASCVRIGGRSLEEIDALVGKMDPGLVRSLLYQAFQEGGPRDPAAAWPLKIDPARCGRIAVEALGLPARVRNALRRNGINDLFALVTRYYGDGLASCAGMGERAIGEIGAFLRRINSDIMAAFLPGGFQAPEEAPIWPLKVDPERCGGISVESLGLSSRGTNALIRNGIHDLRALIMQYYDGGLGSCARVGGQTAAEIGAFLRALTPEAVEDLRPEDAAAPALPQDILRRPVKDLRISLNAARALQKMGVETIGQVLAMSGEEDFARKHQRLQEQVRQLRALGEGYFSDSAFDIDLIKRLRRDYGFRQAWLSQWLDVSTQWVSKALRKTANRGRWQGAPLAEEDQRVFLDMAASRAYHREAGAKRYVILNNRRDDAALLTVAGKTFWCGFLADLPEPLRAAIVGADMHRLAEGEA